MSLGLKAMKRKMKAIAGRECEGVERMVLARSKLSLWLWLKGVRVVVWVIRDSVMSGPFSALAPWCVLLLMLCVPRHTWGVSEHRPPP